MRVRSYLTASEMFLLSNSVDSSSFWPAQCQTRRVSSYSSCLARGRQSSHLISSENEWSRFVKICNLLWCLQGLTIYWNVKIFWQLWWSLGLRDHNINYCQSSPKLRDEIFPSPYVLFLVVLTMKTNEAGGYQGCPIHLVLLYFPCLART